MRGDRAACAPACTGTRRRRGPRRASRRGGAGRQACGPRRVPRAAGAGPATRGARGAPGPAGDRPARTIAGMCPEAPPGDELNAVLGGTLFRLGDDAKPPARRSLAGTTDPERAAQMRWILGALLL